MFYFETINPEVIKAKLRDDGEQFDEPLMS
jgi:hypothetical protein